MILTKNDDGTGSLRASFLDIAILRTLSQATDRTALKNITRVFDVNRDVAKIPMHAGRKGDECG